MSSQITEIDDPRDPNRDEPIVENVTRVRYVGSIEEFRGLYGRVIARYPIGGQTRYSIDVDLPGGGTEQLDLARRVSLIVVESLG